MAYRNDPVSIETTHHVIEISEGCLSIDEKKFPDDCISLSPQETEVVLKLLLTHRYGAETLEELEVRKG